MFPSCHAGGGRGPRLAKRPRTTSPEPEDGFREKVPYFPEPTDGTKL